VSHDGKVSNDVIGCNVYIMSYFQSEEELSQGVALEKVVSMFQRGRLFRSSDLASNLDGCC